ncbi:MAG: phosphate ABC transporter substrate-binding protein PstS [Frankiaceae bacterium]|nr:phosphate ABC transporter substrate-binding protein PstS [Frankiaceae bacterium]MBV9869729.1 phosphate ABC transporter substrate-binding protein PstS [Frankiaceae bacterium]
MKMSLAMRTAGVLAVAAIGLTACGSDNSTGSSSNGSGSGGGTVSLAPQGSTFQAAIEAQWASKFASIDPNIQVTYTGNGSSTGIEQFGEGNVPFAGSDVVMTPDQQAAADKACGSTAISLPITAGGVAIIYNVKGVSNLQLSASTLAKIMSSQITKWNDPAIKAENPGTNLPAEDISIFFRSDGSGTTSILWNFLETTAKADWPLKLDTVDKTLNWKNGNTQGATGSDGVTAGVKNTEGGITYAEVSYAKQNSLPTASIKGAKGGYVAISGATVAKSIQSGFSITGTGNDLAGSLSFNDMTGYPLSTVSYVLACSKYSDAKTGAAVQKYLQYAAGDGQGEADALGFAPLPSSLQSKVQAAIDTIS